jgi:hypothetical protein
VVSQLLCQVVNPHQSLRTLQDNQQGSHQVNLVGSHLPRRLENHPLNRQVCLQASPRANRLVNQVVNRLQDQLCNLLGDLAGSQARNHLHNLVDSPPPNRHHRLVSQHQYPVANLLVSLLENHRRNQQCSLLRSLLRSPPVFQVASQVVSQRRSPRSQLGSRLPNLRSQLDNRLPNLPLLQVQGQLH